MGMFDKGWKATIVYDANDATKPASLSGIAEAAIIDGALHGLTGFTGDTVVTGLAKVASAVSTAAIGAVGASYYMTGNLIPSKA